VLRRDMEKEYIKHYEDKEWLYNEYVTLGNTSKEIGNRMRVSYKLIELWLKKFDIPVRRDYDYV
jgi:transposase